MKDCFLRAFQVRRGDAVSIVGSGGKVTLMYRFAHEALQLGYTVVTTASTHIHPPNARQSNGLVVAAETPGWLSDLPDTLASRRHVTIVRERPRPDKLRGLDADGLDQLRSACPTDLMLIKADGARTRAFKAPGNHEPAVPSWATHCVIVAGLQSVGLPLNEKHVHRIERVMALTVLQPDEPITPEAIGRVVSHPDAYIRSIPHDTRISVYLGWCSDEERRRNAEEIAEHVDMRYISQVFCGAIEKDGATLIQLR